MTAQPTKHHKAASCAFIGNEARELEFLTAANIAALAKMDSVLGDFIIQLAQMQESSARSPALSAHFGALQGHLEEAIELLNEGRFGDALYAGVQALRSETRLGSTGAHTA